MCNSVKSSQIILPPFYIFISQVKPFESPDDGNNLEKLDERQLEEERRRLQSSLDKMKVRFHQTIDFNRRWR